MRHVMFDIDGTLTQSYEFDTECFISSVKDITGLNINPNWSDYLHVTDTGILNEFIGSNEIPDKRKIHCKIKDTFIQKIKERISIEPVSEIPGASRFIRHLVSMEGVKVSLATGGWYESALLKLKSAGIDISNIPMASSNDHYSRVEIMKIAASRATEGKSLPCTYFGDGSWDKKACKALGFNFVLIGNKLSHKPNIKNFESINEALSCAGL